MIEEAIADFLTVIRNPQHNGDDVKAALSPVMQEVGDDSERRHYAITQLAPLVTDVASPEEACFIALVVGYFVENGGDPLIGYAPILTRFNETLGKAIDFASQCVDMPLDSEALQPLIDEYGSAEEIDPMDLVRAHIATHGEEVAQHNPELYSALEAQIGLPNAALAHMNHCPEARAYARELPDFVDRLAATEGFIDNENVYWCHRLAQMLDNEELLVIHPASEQGFRVRISGIGDNFQLHTLLADALNGPDGFPYDTPDPHIAAIARGEQEPEDDDFAVGVFNMVNWTGIKGLLGESDDDDESHSFFDEWIWGEGTPYDIEKFEGTRVVLIDDAPYQRSWQANLTFGGIRPEVTVVEKLTPQQVQDWLQRFQAGV